ncbi:MAG: MBG domain-containing protein, partial [Verrucomicrobiota bacterium]|nr:MBG domain-containing protein [Verrucomicrobiota bacterium]
MKTYHEDGGCLRIVRSLVCLALTILSISANPYVGKSKQSLVINDLANASPYPSVIKVEGVWGNITQVNVRLKGFSHTYPDDVDLIVVGPTGQAVMLLSDAGGSTAVANLNLVFNDFAATRIPDVGPMVGGTFQPSGYINSDNFPLPAPVGPYSSSLISFFGSNPNGEWKLYVVDDLGGDVGQIDGWEIEIYSSGKVTANSPITIPVIDAASPYPSTLTVSGVTGKIHQLKVHLNGFSHQYPDDVDILLVAPNGESIELMSDAGGGGAANNLNLVFDGTAELTIPGFGALVSGSYKPADYDEDFYLSPAPAQGSFSTLASFAGMAPNGDWKLFVMDDYDTVGGVISSWSLEFSTTLVSMDFEDGLPSGSGVWGNAAIRNDVEVFGSSGVMELTSANQGQHGNFFVNNPVPNSLVDGFIATFDLWIGGGDGADGLSFSFGNDLPVQLITEEGAGTGLIISFDTYVNEGEGGPGIEVRYGGTLLGEATDILSEFRANAFVPVQVELAADGKISVTVNGSPVLEDLQSSHVPIPGRFAFAARTGFFFDEHAIDNLVLAVQSRGVDVRPTISCPPDLAVACDESTGPERTGTATAISNCSNPGSLVVTYFDEVSFLGDVQIINRHWVASDSCGTNVCIQQIAQDQSQPSVDIIQESFFNNTVKRYTISSTVSFIASSWSLDFELINNEPGVSFDGISSMTINFSEFRGGAYMGSSFQVSVSIDTACTFGGGSTGSGAGGIQLFALSRGGSETAFGENSAGNDPNPILSGCGSLSALSPAFRFKANESGVMQVRLLSLNSRMVVINDLTVFPFPVAACANSSSEGPSAYLNIPVDAGEVLYVLAGGSNSLVEVSGNLLPPGPILSCPPNVTVLCNEVGNLDLTGTATASSICSNSAVTITYSDSIEDTGEAIIVYREWIAVDACGTNSCIQVITGNRTPPVVSIEEISFSNGVVKQFTVTANQTFNSASWQSGGLAIFNEPGAEINGNTLTINFLIFRGGQFLNSSFNLSVTIFTDCTGGGDGGNFSVGAPPLFALSKGAAATQVEGGGYTDAFEIPSSCGSVNAGGATFRFQASEDGIMRIAVLSPNSEVVAVGNLSVFPFPVIKCTASGAVGAAYMNVPVTEGQIIYVIGEPQAGPLVVSASLHSFAPLLTIPGNVIIDCHDLTNSSLTGVASAESLCGDAGLVVSSTDIVVSENSLELLIHRQWVATDACGSSTNTQVIQATRIAPIVTILQPGIRTSTVRTFELESSRPIESTMWIINAGIVLANEPGVIALSPDELTINFLVFRGGSLFDEAVNISVEVTTECSNGGAGNIIDWAPAQPVGLSKGAPPLNASGTTFPDPTMIVSECGEISAGASTHRFEAAEAGIMQFQLNSPNSHLLIVGSFNSFPPDILGCTNSIDTPVTLEVIVAANQLVYLLGESDSGTVNFAVSLRDFRIAPQIVGLADQVIQENSSAIIEFNVQDNDTLPQDLEIEVQSLTPTLLPASGLSFENVEGEVNLSVTPAANMDGVGFIQVKVIDEDQLAVTNMIQVTVQNVPRSPVVNWSEPADIMYGTPLSETQLNADSSLSGVYQYIPAEGTRLGAGENQELTVVFMPTDAVNYKPVTNQVFIDVIKAPLTITADNKGNVYASSFPPFTATYSGFVNGDTPASLTTPVQLSTTAIFTSPAGTYPITAAGATSPNYQITFVPGTFTITKRTLTVTAENKSKVYGEANPTFTATITGFVNGENASV